MISILAKYYGSLFHTYFGEKNQKNIIDRLRVIQE